MVKAVIFDLDDTLISERQYIESGFRHIAKILSSRLGKDEEIAFQLLLQLLGENPKNVFNRFLDKIGVSCSEKFIRELVEEYRSHVPTIDLFDDVLLCLEFLRKKEIKLGIITDGHSTGQKQKLNAIKAYNYFDEIIITDELGTEFWKPHPRSFEIMRTRLNVKFDEMFYVGDNPEKDFYINRIYPIKTIRIYRQGFYKDKSYRGGVMECHSIDSLLEINSLVERL